MTIPLREHVPLAPLTSWRVGGPARYFLEPTSREDLKWALGWAHEQSLPFFVIGKGSNLLVSDEGFDGLIIRLGERMGSVSWEDDLVRADAGGATSTLVKSAAKEDRGGLEFLSTIPGTVGGVVFMNAGAHGASVSDWLESAEVLFPDGRILSQSPQDLAYAYRSSNLRARGGIVLSAKFRTVARPKEIIQKTISELARWRRERQPQGLSSGSVFTNPPGDSAGRLIEAAGLKGLTIGRAQVSPVHANFFVNLGGASASDLQLLIQEVQEKVHAVFGLWLHPEVQGVGAPVGRTEALH